MTGDAHHDPGQAFRAVAGQLVTGVSIVITLVDGEPFATTVGSVVAASWNPPLLAAYFAAGSRMDEAIRRSGRFTVNLLGEADYGLARRLARSDREASWSAFAGIPHRRRDPAPPVLGCAVAWADCAVTQVVPVGDHHCYVGEVLAMDRDPAAAPLIYYRGRFRTLGPAIAPTDWLNVDDADLAATW